MTGQTTTPTTVTDAPDGGPILEANKVTMRFGGLVANKDIDFTIPRGAIVSLIGPNGAGKTTFFNQLTGMLEPTSGDITFNGESIVGLSPHSIVERGVGRTFQNIRLFGAMTVLNNVMVGAHTRMKSGWWASLLKLPRVRAEEDAIRARPASCSTSSPCRAGTRTMPPRTCRTATSAASSWRAHWPASPSCCSWTSPRPA